MPHAAEMMTATNPERSNTDILVSVSAIVPESAGAVEKFVRITLSVLKKHYAHYEILLIDNGSPEEVHVNVQDLLTQLPNVRLVRLSRNYGTEVALAAALDHSIGDFVVLMDPVTDPPEIIPRLIAAAVGGFDSLTAVPSGQRDRFLDKIVCRPLYRLASRLLGFPLKPNESNYKVFSRRLVNSIVRIRSKNRYLSYLNACVGLSQSTIPYETDAPPLKRSGLRSNVHHLNTVSNILVANSAIPLRFASLLGLLASAANLLYLNYILIVTLVKSHIAEGWLTLSLTNTTMFLLLFLILTILSGYIARLLDETKDQPLYFVESETNSKVSSTSQERLNVIQEHLAPPTVGIVSAR
jgi:polyisoprenyl-phosphate glycosyltransferase